MFYRVIAVAACALLLGGCQQADTGPNSISGSTAPSSLAMKAVDVPFSGVAIGNAVFDFQNNPKACASGFTTITTAKGPATHMGLTTWQSQHCFGENQSITDSELVLTAANGDEVRATYTGSCIGTDVIGQPVICTGSATFSGGTGRFEHATGTGEWRGAITFEGFGVPSWPGRWEWTGTINY